MALHLKKDLKNMTARLLQNRWSKTNSISKVFFFFPVKSCSDLNISFIMVLDSSSEVRSSAVDNQWRQEKDFVKNFIRNSDLGENENIQVAVVNFGADAEIASPCGNLTTKAQFFAFIDNLSKKNGGAALNDALEKARDAYQGCRRLNMLPVVVYLTSGKETMNIDLRVRMEMEELVKSEALLFIGAVESGVNASDVMRMSRYVLNGSEYFSSRFANSFWDLLTLTPESPVILGKVCESKYMKCIFISKHAWRYDIHGVHYKHAIHDIYDMHDIHDAHDMHDIRDMHVVHDMHEMHATLSVKV